MKLKVLFLCATNGVHSPMAEALLTTLDADHFEAASAGILRGRLDPYAVEVMKEIGIDLQGRRTKTIQDVSDRNFDFVITLCNRARSERPNFPGAEFVHWQLDDPLTAIDDVKRKRMFQALRDQIAQRLRLFTLVQVRFSLQHDSSAA
jgi:protein-tyrosine-phosphatase